jgi:hypothetical protein
MVLIFDANNEFWTGAAVGNLAQKLEEACQIGHPWSAGFKDFAFVQMPLNEASSSFSWIYENCDPVARRKPPCGHELSHSEADENGNPYSVCGICGEKLYP